MCLVCSVVFLFNEVQRGGVRWGCRVGGGVRVHVKAMLGVRGDEGYGDVNQE